jgi:hypothetical protein
VSTRASTMRAAVTTRIPPTRTRTRWSSNRGRRNRVRRCQVRSGVRLHERDRDVVSLDLPVRKPTSSRRSPRPARHHRRQAAGSTHWDGSRVAHATLWVPAG